MNIEFLMRDLDRFRSLIGERALRVEPEQQSKASSKPLPMEELKLLSEAAEKIHQQLQSKATDLMTKLKTNWPQNPLISRASLFGPIGVDTKEVLWTKAIAWMLTPGTASTALRRKAHAVFVARILGLNECLSDADANTWTTDAEYAIFEPEGRKGRVDIYLEGKIGEAVYSIGIEAKVKAAESKQQVARYQKALEEHSKSNSACLVFLTPGGKVAVTGDGHHLNMSYEELLELMLPVLRAHPEDEAALFVQLLLADMARGDMARDKQHAKGANHGGTAAQMSARLMKIADDYLTDEREQKNGN